MRIICNTAALLIVGILATACGDGRADPAPFDAVLLELFGTNDTEAYLAATERAAAELVVECMEEAGFEFTIPPALPETEVADYENLEYAREHGFGIVDAFRDQVSSLDTSEPTGRDPNLDYLETLTQEEIQRFLLTLNGVQPEPGQVQSGGCNGSASDEAYADWLRFFEVLPNYTALGEERDSHPDWLAARAVWRTCMTDRQFDYAEPDSIRRDVITRMSDAVNQVYPDGQVPLVEDPASDGGLVIDPAVAELLEELGQFERAAAIANVECTEPVAGEFDAVERLVQGAFVERNQSVIDELLRAETS